MTHIRHGTPLVPLCLVSLHFHCFYTTKYFVPSYATTDPAYFLPSGHSLRVGCVVFVFLFILFTCQSTVPHRGLLHIFRLGTPTARGPVGADQIVGLQKLYATLNVAKIQKKQNTNTYPAHPHRITNTPPKHTHNIPKTSFKYYIIWYLTY